MCISCVTNVSLCKKNDKKKQYYVRGPLIEDDFVTFYYVTDIYCDTYALPSVTDLTSVLKHLQDI